MDFVFSVEGIIKIQSWLVRRIYHNEYNSFMPPALLQLPRLL